MWVSAAQIAPAAYSTIGEGREDAPKRPKSVRDSPIFGMWADRDDIPHGVTYVTRLREPRD